MKIMYENKEVSNKETKVGTALKDLLGNIDQLDNLTVDLEKNLDSVLSGQLCEEKDDTKKQLNVHQECSCGLEKELVDLRENLNVTIRRVSDIKSRLCI